MTTGTLDELLTWPVNSAAYWSHLYVVDDDRDDGLVLDLTEREDVGHVEEVAVGA